jgi:hypothetical protein
MLQLTRYIRVTSACRLTTSTVKRCDNTVAVTSSYLRRFVHSRTLRGIFTSSLPVITRLTQRRWVHGHVTSLGTEPSAIGVSDYDYERRQFKLERPEFFNFASDVIDYWAHKEQVCEFLIIQQTLFIVGGHAVQIYLPIRQQ